jgi:hypothetical protein
MKLSKFEKYTIIFFLVSISVFIVLNINSENKTNQEDNSTNNTLIDDNKIVGAGSSSNKIDNSAKEDDEFSNSIDTTSIDTLSPQSSLHNYIVGNWRSDNFTIDFFENGTFLILIDGGKKSRFGRWKIEDGKFLLKYSMSDIDFEYHNFYETNEEFMIFGYDTEIDSKRYKFYKTH